MFSKFICIVKLDAAYELMLYFIVKFSELEYKPGTIVTSSAGVLVLESTSIGKVAF